MAEKNPITINLYMYEYRSNGYSVLVNNENMWKMYIGQETNRFLMK